MPTRPKILDFDRLNALQRHSDEYRVRDAHRRARAEEYFEVMPISDEKKKQRVELTLLFDEMFFYVLTLLKADLNHGNVVDVNFYTERLSELYRGILDDLGVPLEKIDRYISETDLSQTEVADTTDSTIGDYIDRICREIVKVTISNTGEYWTSEDRAIAMGAEEAGTICNRLDYSEAADAGYATKTWVTMNDARVRGSHFATHRTAIPMDQPFHVGSSYLRFPRDTALGATADEIVNCRCWLEFS